MIHRCLPTVSHMFSMYSIQKLRNMLLFLKNNKLLELRTRRARGGAGWRGTAREARWLGGGGYMNEDGGN
jgi:hypothetical protein